MGKPLLMMILAGGLIGLMLPSGKSHPAGPSPIDPRGVIPSYHIGTAPGGGGNSRAPGGETRLERMGNGHFYADASVNGQPVHLVVDTGASTVALTVTDAQRIGIPFSEGDFDVIGSGASGPVRGKLISLDSVDVDGKDVRNVRGAILEGLDVSLLGQSYLSQIGGVQMSGDQMVLR
ncbi:MAG: aspartyl protease [Alphaproteobacteria bacterium]|nr:aspartyl protease [Alphaproteobacteria bacterium]